MARLCPGRRRGELAAAGSDLVGARLEISGSVPRGSGLSSSAALEVALCLALLAVTDVAPPERLELARLCSRVENDWVGARTGLLDQIASLFGEPDNAMRIDFRSLEVSPVALELRGFSLVTLDSGERHANAGVPGDTLATGYNQRRAECARACELLGIESLRDATAEQARALPDPLAARALHVITENERVQETVAALSAGDLERVGALLDASHASLRDDFEISTPVVERTVARLLDAGAVGARIMGGGFGGHVLGLGIPGRRRSRAAATGQICRARSRSANRPLALTSRRPTARRGALAREERSRDGRRRRREARRRGRGARQ